MLGQSGQGVLRNVLISVAIQAVVLFLAYGLDALGFSEATLVMVFVLAVLLTAVFTSSSAYCLAAAVMSILSFNFFLVAPRLSFQIEGADVPGTMAVMFVVALVASYMVTKLRASLEASADAALIAQNEQLRADLMRSVSHDLRTPLTAISGNADMLLDREAVLDEDERRRLIRDIHSDATWLTGVVENLLTITRMEDGRVRINRQVELLDDVVEESLRHVSRNVAEHELEVVSSNDLILVRVDAHLLVQVVVNLVNNAISHTPAGSHLVVGTRRDGTLAQVFVEDDGPGMADADKVRAFEPFYTTAVAVADGRRGVGLGLPVSRTIVEAHGGTLQVEDVVPHGARFVVSLPLEEVPQYG